METIILNQATDIMQATLQDYVKKLPAMTYLYQSYASFNRLWQGRTKIEGGKKVERYITLHDEGNAKHRGNWEEDTHNVLNIDETITANWVTASSNLSWNLVEASVNSGAAQIYDVIANKYRNALRELVDEVYEAMWRTPTSSTDKLNPFGLPGWIVTGTDDSTGGFTGYTGNYQGSSSTFSVGGLTSSSSVNSRWANWYADHNGSLDETLWTLLDRAFRQVHFEAPVVPKAQNGTMQADRYTIFSNDNVIGNLNMLNAKSDDEVGYRIDSHFGTPTFRGVPLVYVDILNTASTYTYGTDPIIGVNTDLFYPVILSGWDFKISKPRSRDQQHLVLTVDMDLVYTYIMETRRYGGWLINEYGG
jgi:hypothetical protein